VSLLARWFGADPAPAIDERRWIVLDVETTGLDIHHDVLLAIAAVAVTFDDAGTPRIALSDSFEAVLHHASASTDKDNILIHGIGVGAQRAGPPPREVLAAFERWIGRSPLLAFHAHFDRTMIERAMKMALHRVPNNSWLDLEPVAATLHPGLGARALDDWLDRPLRHRMHGAPSSRCRHAGHSRVAAAPVACRAAPALRHVVRPVRAGAAAALA
jgi:DNA polymerase III subunit epsilon